MKKLLNTKLKDMKAITLIALVITIVILIILAGVLVSLTLGDNGLFTKAKTAKDDHERATATETINLKITNVQISSYAEKQTMPTLKELADNFCEDNDFEYVEETSQVASLTKIENENPSSIFTKLKKYPYEFEIDSELKLASIDGVKVASIQNPNEENENFSGIRVDVYLDGVLIDGLPEKSLGYSLTDISCTNDATATFDKTNWTFDIQNIKSLNTVCTINFSSKTLYSNVMSNLNNDELLQSYFSNPSVFSTIAEDAELMAAICENSKLRLLLYNNADVTEPIIQNSEVALEAMKESSRYREFSGTITKGTSYYEGKAFLFRGRIAAYNHPSMGGIFIVGEDETIAYSALGSSTKWNEINKFVSEVAYYRTSTTAASSTEIQYFEI